MVLARILEPLSRKLPVDFRCTAIFSFRPRAGVRLRRFCLFDVCVSFFVFSLFFFFFYDESVDKGWMVFRAFRFREMVKMAELVVELDDIFRIDCTCMDSS